MAKVVLFGDNYIKRLCCFCDERKGLHVPYNVKWYGQGGLRTDRMNTDLYGKMLKEKGDIVIVAVGGNDITPTSQPKEIVRRITEIVNDISRNGCEHVYITEILTRGNFSKCPGLQKIVFDRQRIKINKCLAKTFKNNLLKFPDIKFPADYAKDLVHLESRTPGNNGMRKYQCRLQRLICSVKR
ncbi:hypothetical protein DPMN_019245 [Dreissena polymorpha]|uniref:Uncharacterized protein n=2 Tax=Dreissena polymorpha TaxID=45954 RepID=A0A9D4NGP0_DREPO|nr:hypothetical protein DPMN_019245 [Dreissena polymorpha]